MGIKVDFLNQPADFLVIGSADVQMNSKTSLGDLYSAEKVDVASVEFQQNGVAVQLGNVRIITDGSPEVFPGGGGVNISSTLARLGSEVFIVAPLGNDSNGQIIQDHFSQLGVKHFALNRPRTAATLSLIGEKQSCLLMCKPDYPCPQKVIFPQSPKIIIGASISYLELEVFISALEKFKRIPVFFSPANKILKNIKTDARILQLLSRIDFFQVNAYEAKLLTGHDDLEAAIQQILDWGVKHVIVTLNHSGSQIHGQGIKHYLPAYPEKKRVDPVGCGDAHFAGFVFGQFKGWDLHKCLAFANFCATKNLEVSGASNFPSPKEWESELGEDWEVLYLK